MHERSTNCGKANAEESVPVTGANHGRNTRRIKLVSVIALSLAPVMAWAGGMAFTYSPTSPMEPLRMSEQRAIIAHKDGVQRMFISVNFEAPQAGEKFSQPALWVFPVPGVPGRVDVDVADVFPELIGEGIGNKLREDAIRATFVNLSTQPHFLSPSAIGNLLRQGPFVGVPAGMAGENPDLTAHKVIEKGGVHAEIVSVNSVERLADYLREKNVAVNEERLHVFAPYLSGEYVLVLGWIASYEELIAVLPEYKDEAAFRRPCLYVEFPTAGPFFPMRSTSGYGEDEIAVSLRIVGLVSPDTHPWSRAERKAMSPRIRYWVSDENGARRRHLRFFGRQGGNVYSKRKTPVAQEANKKFSGVIPEGNFPFTSIDIMTRAENLTRDLRFVPNRRPHAAYVFVSSTLVQGIFIVITLLLFSYVAAGIGGKILFGAFRPWARIGLWNCLTVPAVVLKAWWTRRAQARNEVGAVVSGREDAFALGVLMCLTIVLTFRGGWVRMGSESYSGADALFLVQVSLELLVAAWIATKDCFYLRSNVVEDGKEELSPTLSLMWETWIRAFLMCMPVLILLGLPVPDSLFYANGRPGDIIAFCVIYTLEVALYSGLLVTALHTLLWITEKRGSSADMFKSLHCSGAPPSRTPPVIILGALTCLVGLFSIPHAPEYGTRLTETLLGALWRAIVLLGLLIAIMIVRQGSSSSLSLHDRFSPSPLIVFAGLAAPVSLTVFLLVSPVLMATAWVLDALEVEPTFGLLFPAATTIAVIIALIGLLNRNRLKRFRDELTYRTALLSAVGFLGVCAYVTPLLPMLSTYGHEEGLIAVALLLAAWEIKKELSESPTQALRFGLLFSIIFIVLTLAACCGLNLLPTSGW